MAIFIDHRVLAPYPGQNQDIQWHKTHGLLAVGSFSETTGAAVTVYQEEVLSSVAYCHYFSELSTYRIYSRVSRQF